MKRVALIILDGWGINPVANSPENPLVQAAIPNIDELEKKYPFFALQASGLAVGLPWGEAGNSETGHITIGSGRIVYQYLPRIINDIQNGSFFQNPALLDAIRHVQKNNSRLHLMGLLSSGVVHSYIDHLYALLELAEKNGIKETYLHLFTDGKDSLPRGAKKLFANLSERLKDKGGVKIATVIGRHFAMDRDNHWPLTERAYRAMTEETGERARDLQELFTSLYAKDLTDEFITPTIMTDENGNSFPRIGEGDAVIFFNFREDSARQLTRAFVSADFSGFPRSPVANLYFATMTRYEENQAIQAAYEQLPTKNTLGEIISRQGKKQLRVAESEKYAHTTYFFNGNREAAYPGEERILVASHSGSRPDEIPAMKAREVAEAVIEGMKSEKFDLIVANFANADMVGHTGNFNSCIRAAEAVDENLGRILKAGEEKNFILVVTADHGNIERKIDAKTGQVRTEHTDNPVPLYVVGKDYVLKTERSPEEIGAIRREAGGFLADVAPTVLDILSLPKPAEMTGENLLKFF